MGTVSYLFGVIPSEGRWRAHHPTPPISTALHVVAVWVPLQIQLHRRQSIHLLLRLGLLLLSQLLNSQPPVLTQLDPLLSVADAGIFYQRTKDHEEAHAQVDINRLHVGDLGKGCIHTGHQRGHGEHSGDTQADSSGSRAPVEPEGDPGHHHNQAGGDVHLQLCCKTTSRGVAS